MRITNHFLLLIWKNAILLKRTPLRTFFQIATPLFFIAFLVFLRAFKIKRLHKANVTYPAFDVNKLPHSLSNFDGIAFAPTTDDVRQVMALVKNQLSLTNAVGFLNEEDVVKSLVIRESLKIHDDLSNVKFLGAVVFNTSLDQKNVVYKIRLSSETRQNITETQNWRDLSAKWNTQFTFPILESLEPRNGGAIHGGPPLYFEEGFLSIQHAVDVAIIKYKRKIDNLNATVSVKRFPNNDYIQDKFVIVIQFYFPLLLMLSLVFTALNVVRDVVSEKEKKLKDCLKIMGVRGWLNWLAWFLKYFMFLLITVTLATIFLTVKLNSNGRVLHQTSPGVLFVFLMLYALSSIMFCFCITVFFSKANMAAAVGGFLWFFSYIPYFFIAPYYNTMSFGAKAALCLLSNVAMAMGAQLIGEFEGIGIGSQWSNIDQGPSIDDDFSLDVVMVMLVVDALVYGLIAWYVEAVFPGDYVPKSWYFPFLPSYWCGKAEKGKLVDSHSVQNSVETRTCSSEFSEKDPMGLAQGIEIRNLTKVFRTEKGEKVAVNGASLNMYEGEITVLLGHSGAGKTTLMSMLAGLVPATSGSALVNGCSISDNVDGVRSSLGLCQQRDVLFDRLTVEEHLWFYAKLKNCPSNRVKQEVDRMIESIGLTDERYVLARALSDDTKRRLSVGIALLSDSKVLMLDEPTTGMDPSTRRLIWDLLQQKKKGRIVLLATQCMTEADILGNRIAIMAKGSIKCCESPVCLKNKYGLGYHMVMIKDPSCDVPQVMSVVNAHVPSARVESNIGAELSIILPKESTAKFEELFLEMEARRQDLGIISFGASVTTLEDVFLAVGKEDDGTLSEENEDAKKGHVYQSIPAASERSAIVAQMISSDSSYGTFGDYNDYLHSSGFRLFRQRWYAMFVKRLLHSKRHKKSIVFQLLIPLMCTLVALVSAKIVPQPTDFPELVLTTQNFQKNFVPWATDNSSEARHLADRYTTQWLDNNTLPRHVTGDMEHYLTSQAKDEGVVDFNRKELIAATFAKKNDTVNVTAWFNNQAYHAIGVSLAAVDAAILRYTVGTNYTVTTVNHPLPRTAEEKIRDLESDGHGFLISFTMLFGMAFLASSFVVFLVQERTNKAKHVQFVSGVDPISYWSSAYTWDLINFLIAALLILVLVAVFNVPAYSGPRLGYLFLLLMLYAWAIIPLTYIFSFAFRNASTAFKVLTVFNIITGLAALLIVNILTIKDLHMLYEANDLKWIFLVLPNFCLGQGINDIYNNRNALKVFQSVVRKCASIYNLSEEDCGAASFLRMGSSSLQFQDNYLAWNNPGIGRYLIFLAWEGIVFFVLVLLIEYGVLHACARSLARFCNLRGRELLYAECSLSDDDVLAEKERVMASEDSSDMLVIKELTKRFAGKRRGSQLVAVDSLCLGVSRSECVGLLGINGAGKTTVFRMLTGDEPMTSGTVEVRQRIGYCPQSDDALIEKLTGRELLFMYARLRGVPEVVIGNVVHDIIHAMLLQEHADTLTSSYSGDNKRKLSIAVALVGDPTVVLLDEPTTGMDLVTRRLLWNELSRVRSDGRCILLASHSMEECEALCTRLTIMVNGRLKCLGSPQHLKNKFGKGYTLIARLSGDAPDTKSFKEFMEEWFPGSVLKDEHQGMVHYHIRNKRISWAQLFGTIEKVKWNFNIDDYSVSQTTLEQVFLNFARGQRMNLEDSCLHFS